MSITKHISNSHSRCFVPFMVLAISFSIISFLIIPLSFAIDSSSTINEEEGGMSDPCEGSIEKERAPSGAIASWGNFSMGAAVDVDAGEAAPGDEASVIVGSLSFEKSNRCIARLKNSSECNSYSLSYQVKENNNGRLNTKTSGSVSLTPGSEKSFPFACNMKYNYRLEISSAKAAKKK